MPGCSAYMAANQPSQKDFAVFKQGTERGRVIAEFGSPTHSTAAAGRKTDIFTFVQGYHGAVKAGRAIGHGVASIATLGIWEIVGTPVEGHFSGSQLSVQVDYDEMDRVARVQPLKGDEEVLRNLQDVNPPAAGQGNPAYSQPPPAATSSLGTPIAAAPLR